MRQVIIPTKQLKSLISQWDKSYRPLGQETIIYKFKQTSGNIHLTKFGEIDKDIDLEQVQQNFQIFTGKEPITVYWENSVELKANADNTITQTFKVGNYNVLYQNEPTSLSLETKNKTIYGVDYVMNQINYDLVFHSTDWIPNENDIQNYFYLVLDKKANCRKWLQISKATPYYNETNNTIQYVEIVFENINDKYSETGQTIFDFIQNGAIGDGFAFPKEKIQDGNIIIELDEQYLPENQHTINNIQYDFMGGAGVSSFLHWGRRKSIKQQDGTYKLETPKILFIYDIKQPNNSKLFYNKPNLNSFVGTNFKPNANGVWESYKNAYRGNDVIGDYNILNTKQVLTGLEKDDDIVRSSNKNNNTYTNWNKNFLMNLDYEKQFKYQTTNYMKASQDSILKTDYANFLNINAFLNFGLDVFNYDYKETKKWKLTDTLGILGGIINILVGGLDIGWTTYATLSETAGALNLIIPCISYENGKIALDKKAPLPMDVFIDDKGKHILPVATDIMTSWRFRLTDMIKDTSQIREGVEIGKGGNGIWDTKYLGQTKFEDGTYINNDHTPFAFNPTTTIATAPFNNDFDFVIDYVDFKAIASCDYRISAYDKANQTIYQSISSTNAKAKGDIRIWGNQIKFNFFEKQNTKGTITYPEPVESLKPNYDLLGLNIPINQNIITIFDRTEKRKYPFNYDGESGNLYGPSYDLDNQYIGIGIGGREFFGGQIAFTGLFNTLTNKQNITKTKEQKIYYDNELSQEKITKFILNFGKQKIELLKSSGFVFSETIDNLEWNQPMLLYGKFIVEYVSSNPEEFFGVPTANNKNTYKFNFRNIRINYKIKEYTNTYLVLETTLNIGGFEISQVDRQTTLETDIKQILGTNINLKTGNQFIKYQWGDAWSFRLQTQNNTEIMDYYNSFNNKTLKEISIISE